MKRKTRPIRPTEEPKVTFADDRYQREYLSVQEAAEAVRVSQPSIRRLLRIKKLRRFKFGKRTLVRRDELMGLVTAAGE